MIVSAYLRKITELLEYIEKNQMENIVSAAEIAADTIKKDGLIYVFGCGHSHLVALDSFYRAGGLVNVSAMLDTDLMLHNGSAKSSAMEKMEDLAPHIFSRYSLKKNDCIFIISSSGINGVPVEMALCAKEKGIKSIAITSLNYKDEKSRHSSNLHLCEAADMFIDSNVVRGDAVIEINDNMMGSVSTYVGTFILQSVLMEATNICVQHGIKVPVYKSSNILGGGEYNKKFIEEYIGRIKHL